jgi:hypothetical protein
MSNEKPTATAIIRFWPTKHKVTVELDSLVGVSPRNLAIAENLLAREYRGKRGAHNVKRHAMAREAKAREAAKNIKDDENFHKKEDKRLQNLARKAESKSVKLLEAMLKVAKDKVKGKGKSEAVTE